jgi:hypothetical protein
MKFRQSAQATQGLAICYPRKTEPYSFVSPNDRLDDLKYNDTMSNVAVKQMTKKKNN